jgi:hypothetical protein
VVKINYCTICGTTNNLENHHIIFKSQSKALIHCKLNQVYLCNYHHDFLHHDRNGYKLDYKLKLEYQNLMEMLFVGQSFRLEEIQETLGIGYNALYSLSKLMKNEKGNYAREGLIIALCGGQLVQDRYEKKADK